MIVESVNFKTIKIIFDNNDDHLYYGDLLKIIDNSGYGVLVQVFQIDYSSDDSAQNIAGAKILFTIKNSTGWFNWSGNIPAKQSYIEKIQKNELLNKINSQSGDFSVNLGVFSSYNTAFKVKSSILKNPTLVFSDDFFQKIEFTNLLTDELKRTNNKIVILDFNGEFNFNNTAEKIVAGKNFKLPLDTKGIQSLYETLTSDISDETRAIIEDIFLHIEDFTSSSKNVLVPFKNFKDVIDAEYRQSRVVELALLKNKLTKLEKEGIFANKRSETTLFARDFIDNDIMTIDLSDISATWQKYFVEYIIDCNINNLQSDFFLILNTTNNNLDSKIINKLFIQGLNSGISPIIVTDFESDLNKQLLSFAKNLFLFAPKINTNEFAEFSKFLNKLGNNETLIYGQLSKYIPLFVQIGCNTLFEEDELQQDTTDSESINNQNEVLQESIKEEYLAQPNVQQPETTPPPQVQSPKQQEFKQDLSIENINQMSQAEIDYYSTQPQANENSAKSTHQYDDLDLGIDDYDNFDEFADYDDSESEDSEPSQDYQDTLQQDYDEDLDNEHNPPPESELDDFSDDPTQVNEDYQQSTQQRYNQNFDVEGYEITPRSSLDNYSNAESQEQSQDLNIENNDNYQNSAQQRYNQNFDIEGYGITPRGSLDNYNNAESQVGDDYHNSDLENLDQDPQPDLGYYNIDQPQENEECQNPLQQGYNQSFEQTPSIEPNNYTNALNETDHKSAMQDEDIQEYDPQVSEDELDFYSYNQSQENDNYQGANQTQSYEAGQFGEASDDELDFYNYDQPQENDNYHQEASEQDEDHDYDNKLENELDFTDYDHNHNDFEYNENDKPLAEQDQDYHEEENNEDEINIEELSLDDEDSEDFSLDFYEQAQNQPNEEYNEDDNEQYEDEDYEEDDEYIDENDDEDYEEDDEYIDEEDQNYEEEPQNDLSNDEDIESLYTARKPEPTQEIQDDALMEEDTPKEGSEPVVVEIGEKNFSGVNHNIPIYSPDDEDTSDEEKIVFEVGDKVKHQKFGVGVVVKAFKHDGTKFYKFHFESAGPKVLDPNYSPMEKL